MGIRFGTPSKVLKRDSLRGALPAELFGQAQFFFALLPPTEFGRCVNVCRLRPGMMQGGTMVPSLHSLHSHASGHVAGCLPLAYIADRTQKAVMRNMLHGPSQAS